MNIGSVLVFQIAAIALENSGFAVLTGALLCEGWLIRERSPWGLAVRTRMAGIARASAVGTLAASFPVLWAAAATMSDSTLAGTLPMLRPVLSSTHVGHAWLLGAAMLLVLIVIRRFGGADAPIPRAAMWLALAVFIFSRSDAGHAAGAGDFTLAVAVDCAHLLLISIWAGIVIVAAWGALRTDMQRIAPDILARDAFATALSRTASYALIGIVTTGIYNAWRGLGNVANLTNTAYGEVLTIKLLLVMLAIGLGAINRFWVLPQIVGGSRLKQDHDESAALRRFVRILTTESLVLLLAIIAAAVLSCVAPAVSA